MNVTPGASSVGVAAQVFSAAGAMAALLAISSSCGRGSGDEISAEDRALARQQFETSCATCHGLDGQGHGPVSMSLNPAPRDWTDASWQASVDDEDLAIVIAEGGEAGGLSSLMPASPYAGRPGVIAAFVQIVRGFGK